MTLSPTNSRKHVPIPASTTATLHLSPLHSNSPSRPKILHPLLQRLKCLLPGPTRRLPKHQLRLQQPGRRHIVHGLQARVDERVVVLQVHAQAFGFEKGPDGVLGHAVRVVGPWGKRDLGELRWGRGRGREKGEGYMRGTVSRKS